VRALGPSLPVSDPLPNPTLTIYDSDGAQIAFNDDWQTNVNANDIILNGLAPTEDFEAATILHPPAGAYTAIVRGAAGGSGVALLELYDLDATSSVGPAKR
jgi:hypothetical protein